MGSEKYPNENEFDEFVKKHGGYNNAFTEAEYVSVT
jgi:nardilysin